MAPLIYRRLELCAALSIGKSTLAEIRRDDPTFPRPIKINPKGRAIGWVVSDVMKWIERQKEKAA